MGVIRRTGIIRAAKLRFKASYTVEASYVMAIVLMSLAALIGAACRQSQEETATMRLQHMVELMRSQEEEDERTFEGAAWSGNARREGNKVVGSVSGDGWSKEIEVKIHEPEDMMRMLTIFDGLGDLPIS